MLSTDINTLEELRKFSTFIEFVQNPGKYEKILKEVGTLLDSIKESIGPYDTVEKANELNQKAMENLKASEEKAKTTIADLDKQKELLLEEKKKQSDLLNIQKDEINKLFEKAKASEEVANKLLEEAKQEKKAVEDLRERLKEQIEASKQTQLEYQEKVNKLKSVMG